jgi:phage-related protein
MEEGSKTLSGKLSTLRDNFNELLGNAMKPFFDFLSEIAIPKLIELVNKFLNLDPTLQTTATTVAIVAAAIGPLAVVLGTLITIAGGAVAGLTTLIAAFSSIGVIVPVVGGAIAGIVTIFGALILSSEDVRIAIKQKFGAIVNKIKEAANLIKKHFGEIKKAFFELIKGIRTGEFGDFINTMKDLVPPEAMEKIHKLIMKLSQLRDIVIEVRNYTIKNFDDIRGAFENLIKGIATGNFGDFVNNMKNLVPPETMEKIHNLIINFVEFRDKVIDIKNTIVDFGKGVIYALSGVGQIFANTFNNINWEPTITAFNNLKKSLETVKPALAAIGLVVSTVLVVAINMLISVLGSLATIVISAFNVIVSVISFAVNFITALFTDNWGLVYDSTLNLVTALSNLFDGMVSFVINLLKGFVLGIVDFFKFLYETLVGSSIIPDLVNAIIEWFSKLPSKIASIISNLVSQAIAKFNNFKSQVVTIVTNLISKAVEIFNTIKNKIGSIIDSLKSLGQSKFNSIKSVILSIIDSLKNMMQNKFNEAKSKVLSILESLKSGISSKMNSIKSFVQPAINAFNSLRTAISNVISRLASLRFPSPPSWLNKILGHATGIINSPFGHLAVVGEQGPELMYVPKGSDIYTAGQTRQMLSNLRNSSNDGKQIATSPSQVKNNENNVFNVSLNVKASEIKDINDLIELFKGIKAEVII